MTWKPSLPFPDDVWESDWPYLEVFIKTNLEPLLEECKDGFVLYENGWNSEATSCPKLLSLIKKLSYRSFNNITLLKINPKETYIKNSTSVNRCFGKFHFAISHDNCDFLLDEYGTVPFGSGKGFFLDDSISYTITNRSDSPTYHLVIDGLANTKLIESSCKKVLLNLEDQQRKICYGVYNQKERIANRDVFSRSKFQTLYYLKRGIKEVDLLFGDSIPDLLKRSSEDGYDYCVVMASGCLLEDLNYDRVIRNFIMKDKDFGVAGQLILKEEEWLELHHHFFIVNLYAWKKVGKPGFGIWQEEKEQLLPVLNRSDEYIEFKDNPSWVRVDKNSKLTRQPAAGQGWELTKSMFENDWEVVALDKKVRNIVTHLYPEYEGNKFEQSLSTLISHPSQTWNQRQQIEKITEYKNKIRLFAKSSSILNEQTYDVALCPSEGFSVFELFKEKKMNRGSKIIIYGSNRNSLSWYKHFYEWGSSFDFVQDDLGKRHLNLLECMKTFSQKEDFIWEGKRKVDPDEQGDQDDDMTIFKDVSFMKNLKEVIDYFGGSQNFINYWTWFRACKVEFVRLDPIKNMSKFSDLLSGRGQKFVDLIDLFYNENQNMFYGHSEIVCLKYKMLMNIFMIDSKCQVKFIDQWGSHRHGCVSSMVDI